MKKKKKKRRRKEEEKENDGSIVRCYLPVGLSLERARLRCLLFAISTKIVLHFCRTRVLKQIPAAFSMWRGKEKSIPL